MNECHIERATEETALEVAYNMRQPDVDEIWTAGRLSPVDAILQSLAVSRETAGVAFVNGTPVCAFGIGEWSVLNLMGIPWLLGTHDLAQYAPQFLRASRTWITVAKSEYRILQNYVDARNTETIKWLEWLDFTIEPAEPFGCDGLPFHRFHWRAE